VYLLKTKDEALHYFKIYKVEKENQFEKKIKRLRSDCRGKYFSNEFSEFCRWTVGVGVGVARQAAERTSEQMD
jgi:hypothetical protein